MNPGGLIAQDFCIYMELSAVGVTIFNDEPMPAISFLIVNHMQSAEAVSCHHEESDVTDGGACLSFIFRIRPCVSGVLRRLAEGGAEKRSKLLTFHGAGGLYLYYKF